MANECLGRNGVLHYVGNLYINMSICVYIYIYMCVCVCVNLLSSMICFFPVLILTYCNLDLTSQFSRVFCNFVNLISQCKIGIILFCEISEALICLKIVSRRSSPVLFLEIYLLWWLELASVSTRCNQQRELDISHIDPMQFAGLGANTYLYLYSNTQISVFVL